MLEQRDSFPSEPVRIPLARRTAARASAPTNSPLASTRSHPVVSPHNPARDLPSSRAGVPGPGAPVSRVSRGKFVSTLSVGQPANAALALVLPASSPLNDRTAGNPFLRQSPLSEARTTRNWQPARPSAQSVAQGDPDSTAFRAGARVRPTSLLNLRKVFRGIFGVSYRAVLDADTVKTSRRRRHPRAPAPLLIYDPTLRQTNPREDPRAQCAFEESVLSVSCNSHQVSQLAAFFIDPRTE